MSLRLSFIIFSSILVAAGTPKAKWTVSGSIKTPESAYYDVHSRMIYVSNVAGVPDAKDGVGWISQISPKGKVVSEKWVTGLDAPKGMQALDAHTLVVSDIDSVAWINTDEAKVTKKVQVPGAKFLNDVAVSPEGARVFVSDTVGGKIYEFKKKDGAFGDATVFAEGENLEGPNGLLVVGDKLIVAGWGAGMAPDWSVKTLGRLYSLDLKTGKKQEWISKEPLGNLDGLEMDQKGYLVSDWRAGKIFRVANDGKAELLFEGFKGSADIGHIAGKRLLIVPRMGEDMVSCYKL